MSTTKERPRKDFGAAISFLPTRVAHFLLDRQPRAPTEALQRVTSLHAGRKFGQMWRTIKQRSTQVIHLKSIMQSSWRACSYSSQKEEEPHLAARPQRIAAHPSRWAHSVLFFHSKVTCASWLYLTDLRNQLLLKVSSPTSCTRKGTTAWLSPRKQAAWEACAVRMSLDQTCSLFHNKSWKIHSYTTIQKQLQGKNKQTYTQQLNPNEWKSNYQVIFKTAVFQSVKGKQLRNRDVCKTKYLLPYIGCGTWETTACWHLQEPSSDSKEQMKVARCLRSVGQLRVLMKK